MDTTTFSYQPPAGGDISLKSSDGVVFLAHSVLLGMSSSVFSDMLSTASPSDVIELGDDAESVSLMLRFIYPPTFMDDLPIELVEKSLRIAQKYDIGGMITSVDHLLSHPGKQNSPLWSDPLQAFCLASAYNLPETHKAAVSDIGSDEFTFNTPEQISLLTKAFPSSASIIGLLGAQCVRVQALRQLLLQTPSPMLPDSWEQAALACTSCYRAQKFPDDMSVSFRPSWWYAWSTMAFCCLATEPFAKASRVFAPSIFDDLVKDPSVCRDCADQMCTRENAEVFIDWVAGLEGRAKKILSGTEPLREL